MKITLIGIGAMGRAIAERLLLNKYSLTVFNRTPEKALPLVELGATLSNSIEEAVSEAEVIITCLLNDHAVLEVAKTMLPRMKPGAIHIGLSTVLPKTAEELLSFHRLNQTHYISGVVLGVPAVALEGKLTTFIAGCADALNRVMPLLSSFSEHVIPLGDEADIKAPNLMKICMNYSLMTAIELMSELFVFAEKSGLDKEIVKMGLQNIYGHPAFKRYIDKIAERDFDDVNFTMTGGQKDARIFKQVFLETGVTPELANLLNQRYDTALSLGMKDKDWSGIYEVVRKQSGLND